MNNNNYKKVINRIFYTILCIVMLVMLSPLACIESFATSEESSIATIEDETWSAETITASTTRTISGTVTLNGTITINSGVTLTIELASGATTDAIIKRNFGSATANANMFTLLSGAKLIIKGNGTNKIIIDGGNTFTLTAKSNNKDITNGINYSGCAINITEASLELDYVIIQNMYANADSSLASVIKVQGTNEIANNLTLTNTTIRNCLNRNDDAVLRLEGYVNMVNCNFINCCTDGRYGGVIKAGGGDVFCQLTMDECSASGNYSSGWGGVILWAAAATVTVDGTSVSAFAELSDCTFTNNAAEYIGGAISSEATMSLTNCIITNNTARAGGGVATFPFTLNNSTTTAGEACGLTLGEGNVISNNVATASENFIPEITKTTTNTEGTEFPAGGGGIWCLMNKEGWTCELSIGQNNIISQNSTNATGGGVFIHKTIGGDTKLIITGADINSNEAIMGGGVALHDAEFEMSKGIIESNSAGYGGGVYIDGGNVAMSGGSIDGNNATTGSGGGIYATSSEKSITLNIWGGEIINNKATTHGGAFCVNTEQEQTAIITLGLEECKGSDTSLHGESQCPVIQGNKATETGGGFCLHGDNTTVNMYCGDVKGNIAVEDRASNNINQTGGTTNLKGGTISHGVAISGGIFLEADNIETHTITYYSNDGTNTITQAQVSKGVTVSLSRKVFSRDGYYLIGWKTSQDEEDFLYVASTYTIESDTELYAVWATEPYNYTYTVSIPDTLEIDEKEKIGTITINATLKYFANVASLNIILKGKEELTAGNSKITYDIKNSTNDITFSNNDVIATFSTADTSSKTLNIEVTGKTNYAGNHTDVLTFTVEYVDDYYS